MTYPDHHHPHHAPDSVASAKQQKLATGVCSQGERAVHVVFVGRSVGIVLLYDLVLKLIWELIRAKKHKGV